MAGEAFAQQSPVAGALAHQLNDAFSGVYEKVAPAVVVIEVRHSTDRAVGGLPDGWEFLFKDGRPQSDEGSGFLISKDGYIITNNHVVAGAAEGGIKVSLKDGRKFSGSLVGADEKADIAVVKIDAKDLPFVELADSDAAKVGQFAFAIGAPFDLPYTFTVGVISAKNRNNPDPRSRNYEEYIQTDASINPGNSGGPLCDLDGRVIGINTLISGMNRGLGFAVPSNIAKDVSAQLIANGRVSRPWLGIQIMGLGEREELQSYFPGMDKGVIVMGIEPETPAYSSDLRAGDLITKVDGKSVALPHDLQHEILSKKVGQEVKLEVWREGRLATVALKTGEQPDTIIRTANPGIRPLAPSVPPRKKTQAPPTGAFGMNLQDVPSGGGAKVTALDPDGAASVASLQTGDVITEVGGKPVTSQADFNAAVATIDPSRGVVLAVDRAGQKTFAILKP
ncbi:DegQ family serine endoprotease [soil metagenome]